MSELRAQMNAALLAQLREGFAGELPAWLEDELLREPGRVPAEMADAYREAAAGDAILRAFAERLAPRMPPSTCAHKLLAHELLIAAAVPASRAPGCAVRELGCGGPCALRCHSEANAETLALLRQAIRYVSVAYEFSQSGAVHADQITWVKRRVLERLALERV